MNWPEWRSSKQVPISGHLSSEERCGDQRTVYLVTGLIANRYLRHTQLATLPAPPRIRGPEN